MIYKNIANKTITWYCLIFFIIVMVNQTVIAYEISRTGTGQIIKWTTNQTSYLINTNGGPPNSLVAIYEAMNTWTQVQESRFNFIYEGTTTNTSFEAMDGFNLIHFGPIGSEGTIALNKTWYNTETGELLESDIRFNTNYSWGTEGLNDAYDVQNVATHELGHSLSLADLYGWLNINKVMYGSTCKGEIKKRTLHQDDIDGISFLYPYPAWHPNGTLVEIESDDKKYIIENRAKKLIFNEGVFDSYNFDLDKIVTISPTELSIYWDPNEWNGYNNYESEADWELYKLFDKSTVWRKEWKDHEGQWRQVLRPIKSEEVYVSWGHSTEDTSPPDGIWDEVNEVSQLPDLSILDNDPLLLRDGTLVSIGNDKYVIENGRARRIENDDVFYLLGYTDESLMTISGLDRLIWLVYDGIGEDITQATIENVGVAAYFPPLLPTANVNDIGQILQGGSASILNYSVSDDEQISSANLYLTSDGWNSSEKLNSSSLAAGVQSASGTFTWNVPDENSNEAGIRLIAYDNEGNMKYDYTEMFSIESSGTLPSPPNLSDPGLYSTTGNFTVRWNDVPNATSYKIREDDNSNFTSPNEYTLTESQFPVTGYANGFYYYQAKSVNNNGESDWSNIVDMEVRVNQAPYVPSNPSPPDNALDIPIQPTFLWDGGDPDGDDTIYRVLLGTSPTSQNQINGDLTEKTYIIDYNLNRNTLYYWRIWSRDSEGLVTESPVWKFTTVYLFPDLTVTTASADDNTPEVSQSVQVSSTIKNIGNEDVGHTIEVKYYFSKVSGACETYMDNEFIEDDINVNQEINLNKTVVIPKVSVGAAYIDVYVNPGNNPNEDVRNNNIFSIPITVQDTQAPQLTLYYPPNLSYYETLHVCQIVWEVTDNYGVDHYDFYYSLDDGQNWEIIEEDYVTQTGTYNWIIPDGAVTTTARVKMNATDLEGLSATEISDVFEIVDGSGATVQVLTPNGGESWDLGSTYEISWTADSPNNISVFYVYQLINNIETEIAWVSPDQFSYNWTLPASGASDQALIKVTAHDEYGTITEDVSDNYFSMNDPNGPPPLPWDTPVAVTQVPDLGYQNIRALEDQAQDIAIDSDANVHIVYIYYEWDSRDSQSEYYDYQVIYRQKSDGIWQEPIQVTNYPTDINPDEIGTHFITDAHIDVDDLGYVHIIWIRGEHLEDRNQNDDVFYSIYDGNAWSTPEILSSDVPQDPKSKTMEPDIVVDSNGNVHVVWTEQIWDPYQKTTYHKIKSGSSWSSLQTIATPANLNIDLAADALGNVHMIACEGTSVYHNIFNGTTWTVSNIYSDTEMNFGWANLKKGQGNDLHASWRRTYYDPEISQNIESVDYMYWNGSGWTEPVEIITHINGSRDDTNALAVDSQNNPFFFWIQEDKSTSPYTYTLYSVQKTSAGLSPILRISDQIMSVDEPIGATSYGDELHVIWQGYDEGDLEVIYNHAVVDEDNVPPSVTVTAPAMDDVFSMGEPNTISWEATDNVGVVSVDIDYSSDGGANYQNIATGEANDGEYSWLVPAILSESAIVSITAIDAQGNDGIGYSPRFKISDLTPPTVILTSPNGGESYQAGSTQTIEWAANDNLAVTNISLSYSIDGGGTYLTISNEEENDGQAEWIIPSVNTENAMVRIIAHDSHGNSSSDVSDGVFTINSSNNPPLEPYAPIPADDATQITLTPTLSWKGGDPDDDPTTFDVFLDTNSPPTTQVADNISEKTFSTSTLNVNTTYYWQIVASDGIANTLSPVWSFQTGDASILSPSNLIVSGLHSNSVDLQWQDNSDNETQFIIQGKTDEEYSTFVTESANVTSSTINELQPNTQYTFRIYASNGSTNSGYSNEALAITTNSAPYRPTNPSPDSAASALPIDLTLTWSGGDPDVGDTVKYYVHFGKSSEPSLMDSVVNSTSYQVSDLDYNTFYFWKIVAEDLQGTQTSGNTWSFSTGGEPLPAPPTNLSHQDPNSAAIDINWTDNATNEVGFKLGRRLSGQADYTQIAVVQENETEYSDENGLLGDSTYVYAVRSYNSSGNSDYSNETQVIAPRVSYFDFPISEGSWYMISLPVTPFDDLVSNLFPTALDGHAWEWNGTEYSAVDNMAPQNGYWLPLSENYFGEVAGYGFYEYTIHFSEPGWYLIGGVVDPVAFTNPNDTPDGSIITPAYCYDPYSKIYYTTDSIEPKRSYWVAVLQECDLNIGGQQMEQAAPKALAYLRMSEESFYATYGATPPLPPNIDWRTGKLIVIPDKFSLYQNYPNPFNPTTTIMFDVPEESQVQIVIFNILGQKVKTLMDTKLSAGSHRVDWNGTNESGQLVTSGIYICRFIAGNYSGVKKLIYLR